MNCKRYTLSLLFTLFALAGFSQSALWNEVSTSAVQPYLTAKKGNLPSRYKLAKLNRTMASDLQRRAPLESGAYLNFTSSVQIDIPLPDGSFVNGAFTESRILTPELQQAYPGIKTYRITELPTKNQMGRLTFTDAGISGIIFTSNGTVYLHPLGPEYPDVHMMYFLRDSKETSRAVCGVSEDVSNLQPAAPLAGDCQLRTYRIGIAATGEYTTWAGGSQATAIGYITTSINNVSAIYEREMAVRLTLVTNNSLVFTNSGTDPYTIGPLITASNLAENQTTLTSVLTSSGFDLGMVYHDGWNGGLASVGVVCNNSFKGRSASGYEFGTGANPTSGPQGPVFDLIVAHEIGHQFSATHSFSATNGACAGNATPATAYEPGGGSTIMAYGDVCTGNFYQSVLDPYFHAGNITQMQSFIASFGTCVTPTALLNTAPGISVPAASYTIPISTPFTLTSTGTDADGNTLYYNWDQIDGGLTTTLPPQATSTGGANFRSYPPSVNGATRNFPDISYLITGTAATYEVLPSVARALNFRATVRDFASGGGCTAEANVTVNTNAGAGPFVVTSQSTPTTLTSNSVNTFTITWNVANTNAAPINTTNVDILFSTDGGYTYPYPLLLNTSNDGSETILVPNLPTVAGRIRVQARNNIFFNINSANITINSACAANGASFTPTNNVSANAGSPTLNLTLSPAYGAAVPISGTLASTDPLSYLTVNDVTPPACKTYDGNESRYDVYTFIPTVSGNYSFSKSAGTFTINLYSGHNFLQNAPCAGFIISNITDNAGLTLFSGYTAALVAGQPYSMVVGTFSNITPTLPFAYTVTVTPPPGGALLNASPSPGAGFNYTYVIVNNATGNVVAIDPSADLSNSTNFPAGSTYTVVGLSYSNTIPIGTINSYIGGSFLAMATDFLYNPATRCGNMSKNSIQVAVLGVTPVNFLGLTATKSRNKDVLLKWKTASEQNNDHFEIERSGNGVNFSTIIGKVPGRGTTNQISDYGFTDASPINGWNFYRIKQVDFDGKASYSNTVSLQFKNPSTIVQLYPNPVQQELTVIFTGNSVEKIELSILDSKGALVQRVQANTMLGVNRLSINTGTLSAGIYTLKTSINGKQVIERFVKQ